MKKGEIRLYNILIKNIENKYEYDELIKVFLPPDQFCSYTQSEYNQRFENEFPEDPLIVFNEADFAEKNYIKREIYQGLSQITGTVSYTHLPSYLFLCLPKIRSLQRINILA